MDHRKGQRTLKKEQRKDLIPDLQKGPKMKQQMDQMTAQKDQLKEPYMGSMVEQQKVQPTKPPKVPKMKLRTDQMTAQKDQPTKQRKGQSTRWGYRSLGSAEKNLQTCFNTSP
jgi:hypothetical protein